MPYISFGLEAEKTRVASANWRFAGQGTIYSGIAEASTPTITGHFPNGA
jgi:hypothetical protein